MIEIEEGSGNVYADLQMPDADAMYVKARLASKIGDIVGPLYPVSWKALTA